MNYLVNKFDFILEKNEDIIDEFFKDFFSKKFKKMLMKYPVNEDNTTFLENIVFNISNSIVLYKKQKLQDYPKCNESIREYFNVVIRMIEFAIVIKYKNLNNFKDIFFNISSTKSCFFKHFREIESVIYQTNSTLLEIKKNLNQKNKITVFIGGYPYQPSSVPQIISVSEESDSIFWFERYFKLNNREIQHIFDGEGSKSLGISNVRNGTRSKFIDYNYDENLDQLIFSDKDFQDLKEEDRKDAIASSNHMVSTIFNEEIKNDLNIKVNKKSPIHSSYKQFMINKAISTSIAKNEMFLYSKAPNIELFKRLVLIMIESKENYYSSLLIIALFTGISVKNLLLIFTKSFEEIMYLQTLSSFRVKINSEIFAKTKYRDFNVTRSTKNKESNIEIPDFLNKLCLYVLAELKKKYANDDYSKIFEVELKCISQILTKHKKKIGKKISNVNVNSMHKLFYHYFHIFNEKTDSGILILNNISKKKQAQIAYTSAPQRLINYEYWIVDFYHILTNKSTNLKNIDGINEEFIGSPKYVEPHIFKNFLKDLYSIPVKTEIEKLNLQMIFIHYSLIVLLATRGLPNLSNFSDKTGLLIIHEKVIGIKSGKCLKPLSTKAIELIKLFYNLKKEFKIEGYSPVLFTKDNNKLNASNLDAFAILGYLENVLNAKDYEKLSIFINGNTLNFGRHIFSTRAFQYELNREYKYEFLGHYTKSISGQGIYSNFDTQKYIKTIREFMKDIEKDYFPDFCDPKEIKCKIM